MKFDTKLGSNFHLCDSNKYAVGVFVVLNDTHSVAKTFPDTFHMFSGPFKPNHNQEKQPGTVYWRLNRGLLRVYVR